MIPGHSGDREAGRRTINPASVRHWEQKRPLEGASGTDGARSAFQRM